VSLARRMKHALYSKIQTGLLLLLLFGWWCCQPAATVGQEKQDSPTLPEGATSLPEGEARTIILSACVQCHNLRTPSHSGNGRPVASHCERNDLAGDDPDR